MVTTLNHYRVWCVTNSKWEYVWAETAPTVCPDTSTDTIDVSKTAIIDTIPVNYVQVSEASVSTAGYLCEKGWDWDIPASIGDSSNIISLPFAVDVMSAKFTLTGAEQQDHITAIVGEDSIIGLVDNVSNQAIGDKLITVDNSVSLNGVVGRVVKFGTDPTEYWITARDKVNNTITIWPKDGADTGLVMAALDNDVIKMSIYLADRAKIVTTETLVIGSDKFGGSYLPGGTAVNIIFNNSTATAKHLHMNVEFLYGDG